MEDLDPIIEQGRMARQANDDNTGSDGKILDTGKTTFSEHNCPYGPGANRDAWLEGFFGNAGADETVEQADLSTPSSDDVRHVTPEVVHEGSDDADASKVVIGGTGTAETALQTHVQPVDPAASDAVPTPDTIIGDPAASQGPNDANVMHTDEAQDSAKTSEPDASNLM